MRSCSGETGGKTHPGVRLFVGGYSSMIHGERFDLAGDLEFSAAHHARSHVRCADVTALLDSGAYTDPPEKRLIPDEALARQLRWENRTAGRSGCPDWQVAALVSYDRLIDETWTHGKRVKRRWSIRDAETAVAETIASARFLASCREFVAPRTLILSCQGVDAIQYAECAAEVLRVTQPGDWLGLGGWCILGRNRTWLPEFWRTLEAVLPLAAVHRVRHVHIFGVTYLPALGGLLYLADLHNLSVSTDSAKPVLDSTRSNPRKAGVRVPNDWRGNVRWWIDACANLRASEYYRQPPRGRALRQLTMELA